MQDAPKITHALPHGDHSLMFENGEQRAFDLKPYLDTPVFAPLRDLDLFRQVHVVYGSLEWPGGRDFTYDLFYAASMPLTAEVK